MGLGDGLQGHSTYCTKHKGELTILYCEQCSHSLCVECAADASHDGHKKVSLKNVLKGKEQSIISDLNGVYGNLKNQIRLLEKYSTTKSEIIATYQQIRDIIDQEEKQALEVLTQEFKKIETRTHYEYDRLDQLHKIQLNLQAVRSNSEQQQHKSSSSSSSPKPIKPIKESSLKPFPQPIKEDKEKDKDREKEETDIIMNGYKAPLGTGSGGTLETFLQLNVNSSYIKKLQKTPQAHSETDIASQLNALPKYINQPTLVSIGLGNAKNHQVTEKEGKKEFINQFQSIFKDFLYLQLKQVNILDLNNNNNNNTATTTTTTTTTTTNNNNSITIEKKNQNDLIYQFDKLKMTNTMILTSKQTTVSSTVYGQSYNDGSFITSVNQFAINNKYTFKIRLDKLYDEFASCYDPESYSPSHQISIGVCSTGFYTIDHAYYKSFTFTNHGRMNSPKTSAYSKLSEFKTGDILCFDLDLINYTLTVLNERNGETATIEGLESNPYHIYCNIKYIGDQVTLLS